MWFRRLTSPLCVQQVYTARSDVLGSVGEETVVFRAVATPLPHPAANLLPGQPHQKEKKKEKAKNRAGVI